MSHSRYLDRPRRSYEEVMRAREARDRARDARGNGADETGREGPFSHLRKAWLSGIVLALVLAALAGVFILPSFVPDEPVIADGITPEEIQRLQMIAPAAGPVQAPDSN